MCVYNSHSQIVNKTLQKQIISVYFSSYFELLNFIIFVIMLVNNLLINLYHRGRIGAYEHIHRYAHTCALSFTPSTLSEHTEMNTLQVKK